MSKKNRLLRLLLTLTLTAALTLPCFGAAGAATIKGSGTAADPYQINSTATLNAVRDDLNAYYKLTADITFSKSAYQTGGAYAGGFVPIGSEDKPFTGTLDGDGHTISNLQTKGANAGLLAFVYGGTLKNLTLSGGSATGELRAGAFAARAENALLQSLSSDSAVSSYYTSGGIVGEAEGCNIALCSFSGEAATGDGFYTYCGGIAAVMQTCGVTYCASSATLGGAHDGGGIAGASLNSSIRDSYNAGATDGVFSGGIAGYMSGGTIAKCYNSGAVSGALRGGIVGYCDSGAISGATYLNETAGIGFGSPGELLGVDAEQLSEPAAYPGFDFENVWLLGGDGASLRASIVPDGWLKENGVWYYIEGNTRLTGEHELTGYSKGGGNALNTYYFNADGSLYTGFRKTANGWVFHAETGSGPRTSVKGQMLRDAYVENPSAGYRSPSEQGRTYLYFFDENGLMYKGWHNDRLTRGYWMYFGEDGSTPVKSRVGRQFRYGLMSCIGNGGEKGSYMFSGTGVMFTGTNSLGTFCTEGENPALDKLGRRL